MKKKFILALFFLVALSSCYKDYIEDFDYSSIYFPYQTNVRTFVVGEGMTIEVGAALAGVRDNTRDRLVNFTMDGKLLTDEILETMKNGTNHVKAGVAAVTALKMVPSNYFTISSNNQMIIKKGTYSGTVVIKADSAAFLADPATLNAVYAMPFYINSADADSVAVSKRYAVIGLKYENMLFGNYWHGGVTTVKDSTGKVVRTTNYYTTIPSPEVKVMNLKTVAPNALETNLISNQKGAFRISLNGNTIEISQAKDSKVKVLPDGPSTFNRSKLLQDRKLFLKYKYANADGTTSYATDTLTFRNRIRDGVNEWQDENPSHYN
ncbi:DUF1735 domain-containing protein [Persicitalea jodogahamensis]|uniref:BT-3987-like N-terminal domain-containing protein n=1 Tax=Persicitalea jodogahamensis TaxID=402147 RepID=A0A8J3D328_9BACT|nr:DUF1735 domain-containing protein [Persicitalea jodogahamensis]GHB62578.1 hypothetical protein GCM10007390_15510 [Persicitalea jodogahamensis]